jgi:succinate dehydrogenase / fumarate reductase flavoprotein subunit
MDFPVHDHDVLIIGAGGAGLRAAIESSANGAKTAVITKSLLGKAHTVMAEGAWPRRWPTWTTATTGRCTSPTRCAAPGPEQLAHGRAAQGIPDRVRELGRGAVFDRTSDGRILQRNFGALSAPAHVGDRTGSRDDPHAQDYGVHQGLDVFMGTPSSRCRRTRVASSGVWRMIASAAASHGLPRQRRHGDGAKAARPDPSNSWGFTGDGYALVRAGAAIQDLELSSSIRRVWLAAERERHPRHRGCPRRGGVLLIRMGAGSCSTTSRTTTRTRRRRTRKKAGYTGDKSANRPPALTRDHVARCIMPGEAPRQPHGGVFLDIA